MVKFIRRALATVLAASLVLTAPAYATSVNAAKSPTSSVTPTKQDDVKASNGSVVDTTKSGKAAIESIKKTNSKSVKINSTVKVDGVKYTVVSIGAKAFANAKKATTVTLPKTVTSIKAYAFKSSKVKTVKMTSTTKAVKFDKKAFKGKSTKTMKIVVSKKMSTKEFKKMKKYLKKAGYKGKLVKG